METEGTTKDVAHCAIDVDVEKTQASSDGTLKVWDIRKQRCALTVQAHDVDVNAVGIPLNCVYSFSNCVDHQNRGHCTPM
jgi:WD40 repeat protein